MSSLNAVVAWIGTFSLAALAILVFGSVLLRFFGIACMVVATVFLLVEANLDTADAGSYLLYVPMATAGLAMWVAEERSCSSCSSRSVSTPFAGFLVLNGLDQGVSHARPVVDPHRLTPTELRLSTLQRQGVKPRPGRLRPQVPNPARCARASTATC